MVSFNGDEGRLHQRVAELEAKVGALQAAEQRSTIALAKSSVGVFDWDLDHRQIYVSPILQDMLGYVETGLPAQLEDWLNLLDPQDWFRAQKELREVLAYGSEQVEAVYRMKRRDGAVRQFVFRAVIMRKPRGDGGGASRVLGSAIDITGLKAVLLRDGH